MILEYGPITVAEARTVEGKRRMVRALFPEVPALHNATAEQFDAMTRATSEADWLASYPTQNLGEDHPPS